MKNFAQATLLLLSFTFIGNATAGVLVEPVLGYQMSTKLDLDGPGGEYSGGKGPAFGGRLGYQNLGFQLGLDYLHSSADMDDNDFDGDFITDEWAAFVGFEFPVMFRVYAGYIFSATGEVELNGGQDLEFSKGTGTKLGVGFTGLPFIDINVEYKTGEFTEAEFGPISGDADTKYSSLMVGISAPFNL
ncbi:MAG TPA: outer membrane beta-barrel protein [Bacteriovoracaceae bacterium]|nr:outer membrane beta-barrel protein [Bacteriovoracaceae bacterium]